MTVRSNQLARASPLTNRINITTPHARSGHILARRNCQRHGTTRDNALHRLNATKCPSLTMSSHARPIPVLGVVLGKIANQAKNINEINDNWRAKWNETANPYVVVIAL